MPSGISLDQETAGAAIIAITEAAPKIWEPCDPTTICPLNSNGVPDMFNHMPSRMISRAEALARHWPYFYDSSLCRYGHQAPHYRGNPRLCVDCVRARRGKVPIGAKAASIAEYSFKPKEPTPGRRIHESAATIAARLEAAEPRPEPDPKEKKFLEVYAKLKDIDEAAKQVGLSGAQVEARISWSSTFSRALNALEDRLGIKRTVAPGGRYWWSEEKRKRLVEVYVDTGDLATARDSIRVTPSEFFREIERNTQFDEEIKLATQLAERALEERAIQLALAGNDKLLTKILSAKKPEYRERLNVEMKVEEKLDDRQLNARLARLLSKVTIVEGSYREIESSRQDGLVADSRRSGEAEVKESNSNLLQYSGESSPVLKTS